MDIGKETIIHIANIVVNKMTKILIKKNETTMTEINNILVDVYKEKINRLKETKEGISISFCGSLFDNIEEEIFKIIKSKFEIIKIIVISRSFEDIHKATDSEEFKKNLKLIQEKINPYYVIKNDGWWVGLKEPNIKDFDVNKTLKEIYKIGLCCGLVPKNMVN
jgi:hypothetical protein